jgi:hypothetical protein
MAVGVASGVGVRVGSDSFVGIVSVSVAEVLTGTWVSVPAVFDGTTVTSEWGRDCVGKLQPAKRVANIIRAGRVFLI